MTIETSFKPQFHTVEKDWRGSVAFIVGGGPSLIGYDFDRLQGKNVIAVKEAAIHIPWATTYFSMDIVNWKLERRLKQLEKAQFQGEIVMACAPDWKATCDVSKVKFLIRDNQGTKGLSFQPDRVRGHNSGYAALNYAVLKGANVIVLMGLDFTIGGYWFNPESLHWTVPQTVNKETLTREDYIQQMQIAFAEAAKELEDHYISVFNTGGSLTCFPMLSLDAFLDKK